MILRITSRWEAHAACGDEITHLISIQNPQANLDQLRPASIAPENHLILLFEDVDDPDHPDGPKEDHLQSLASWLRKFDSSELQGMVVHCDAGVSRSTAAAWVALLILEPEIPASAQLERVAQCCGHDYCWPSNLVTAHAERVLDLNDPLTEILSAWKKWKPNH